MLLSGSIGLLSVRRGKIMIAALWAAFGCLLYPGLGPVKGGTDTLAEFESLYNYIQVVKKNGLVLLYLNDGNGDHSVHDPGSKLVGGYWDTFLALPAMSALTDEELKVLIIGLGGGTIANQLSYYWREKLHIDGVEIDGKIIEAADRFFALDRRFLDVHVDDGRRFLSRAEGLYQVIILDAYRQPYIPFHLTTVEFFRKCRDHLNRGGVVGINVATFRENPEFLQMIAETLGSVFPYVYVYEIPNNDGAFKNVVLVAASDPPRLKGLAQAFPNGPPDILGLVEKKIKPLVMRDKPRVMSDDWAPLEWQVDKTLFNF